MKLNRFTLLLLLCVSFGSSLFSQVNRQPMHQPVKAIPNQLINHIYELNQNLQGLSNNNSIDESTTHRKCATDELMAQKMANPTFMEQQNLKMSAIYENAATYRASNPSCAAGPIIIPVAFHFAPSAVGSAAPTAAQRACIEALVDNQLAVVNRDFSATNTDVSNWATVASNFTPTALGQPCIQFCLATQNHPSGYGLSNGQKAITFGLPVADSDLTPTIPGWNGYLNIVVQSGTGVLGISNGIGGTFAGTGVTVEACCFAADPATDCYGGLVGAGCSGLGSYNLGRTLTHEIGHYLGLLHTFSGCGGTGDGIADTPPDNNPDYGCYSVTNTAAWPDDCAGGQKDMWMNYMNYGDDFCLWMFTSNQSDVMHAFVVSEGFTTTNPAVCETPIVACPSSVSALTASASSICSGSSVTYSLTATGGSEYTITYTPAGGTATTLAEGVNTFTLSPTHPGTCGTFSYVVNYTVNCTLDGSVLASSSTTITVFPTAAQLASFLTITNGTCDGPIVNNTCPSLITVTPVAGSPTFPVAAGASGTVDYDVVYNLGPCCVSSPGAQLLTDGDFEDGDPATGWAETSTNFSFITCDNSCGGTTSPWAGTFYGYFGGAAAGLTFPEVGTITQTVTIPTGVSASMTFQMSIPNPGLSTTDVVNITVNGTIVWSINSTTDGPYATGTPTVTIDLSSYATGTPITIVMNVTQTSGSSLELFVDNFALNTTPLATGCNTTANGSYNCVSSCDEITSLTTTTASVCAGSNISFSGLSDNNDANGIALVYSSSALSNPYTGGTLIGNTTGSGTSFTFATSTLPVGTHFVYAILSPTPADATCRPFATTNVTVNAIPTAPTAADVESCGGGPVTLTATGCAGGTINWYSTATGGTSLATGTTFNPTVSSSTSYYLDCTIAGCTSTRSMVDVTINPVPVVSVSGTTEYCQGENINLVATATPGSFITWDTPTGTITGNVLNIPAATPGVYTIGVTATLGSCVANSFLIVNVFTVPGAPTVDPSSVLSVCNGDDVNIVLGPHTATTTTSWYNNATLTSLITGATGDSYSFSPSTSGSVWVVFTDLSGGCQGPATQVDYTVESVASATVNPSITICADALAGNTLDLSTLISSGDNSGTWAVTSGIGSVAGSNFSNTASFPSDETNLTYTLASTGTCPDNVYNVIINYNDCNSCPDITSGVTVDQTNVCTGTIITACVEVDLSNDADATVDFNFGGTIVPGVFTPGITPPPTTHTVMMVPFAPYMMPSGPIYVGDIIELPGTPGHPLSTTSVPAGASSVVGETTTFSYTITTPGSYSIICDFHPSMTGSFEVLPALSTGGTFCAQFTTSSTSCAAALNVTAMFAASSIDATCDLDMQAPVTVSVNGEGFVAVTDLGASPMQCGPFIAGGSGCGITDGDETWTYCVDYDGDGICELNGTTNSFTPIPGTGGIVTFTLTDPDGLAGCGFNTASTSFNCPVGLAMTITDPCVCEPGGFFSDVVSISGGVGPYTISSVSGAFEDNTGTMSINSGDAIAATSTLYHADGVGYSLEVTDATGMTVSISNSCNYPTASITASDNTPACNSSITLSLVSTGTISSIDWYTSETSTSITTGPLTTDFTASVTIEDAQGCIVTADQAIDVEACGSLATSPDFETTNTVTNTGTGVTTGTPVSVDVLSNDNSPFGPATVTTVSVDPASGTVSVNPITNEIVFTPNPSFTGDAIINYTISDGTNSASGILTVTVTNVLPVTLLSALTTNDCKTVKINWSIASEENTKEYQIERSTDGINFEYVSTIEAAGNSITTQFYNFSDNFITTSNTYYRIVEVSMSAERTIIKTLFVEGNCSRGTDITNLFPNPTTGILNYSITSDIQNGFTLQILDVTGRVLTSENLVLNTGLNTFIYDASSLSHGVYFMNLISENNEVITTKKFVKAK